MLASGRAWPGQISGLACQSDVEGASPTSWGNREAMDPPARCILRGHADPRVRTRRFLPGGQPLATARWTLEELCRRHPTWSHARRKHERSREPTNKLACCACSQSASKRTRRRSLRAFVFGPLRDRIAENDELPPEEWEAAWSLELEQRLADVRAGKVKRIPASRVIEEALALARRSSR